MLRPTLEPLEPRDTPTAAIIGEPTLTIADHSYTLRVVDDTHAAIDRPDGTTIIAVPEWASGVQIVAAYVDPGTAQPEVLHFLYSGTLPGGAIQIWNQQSSDFGEHFAAALLAMEILPAPEGEAMMASLPPDLLAPTTETVQPVAELLPMPRLDPDPDDLGDAAAAVHALVPAIEDAGLALVQALRFDPQHTTTV